MVQWPAGGSVTFSGLGEPKRGGEGGRVGEPAFPPPSPPPSSASRFKKPRRTLQRARETDGAGAEAEDAERQVRDPALPSLPLSPTHPSPLTQAIFAGSRRMSRASWQRVWATRAKLVKARGASEEGRPLPRGRRERVCGGEGDTFSCFSSAPTSPHPEAQRCPKDATSMRPPSPSLCEEDPNRYFSSSTGN